MAFIENGLVDRDFAELMGKVSAAYQNSKLTAAGIYVYASALGDFTFKQVRCAFSEAVKTCTFFPSIAELIKILQPTVDDAALIAWTGFASAAADVGAYSSLETEDAAAGAALAAVFGSWPDYCEQTDVAVNARRSEFLAAYRQARRTGQRGPYRLAGVLEAGGQYPRDGRAAIIWRGRIDARGAVRITRDVPALTEGRDGDDDARAAAGEAGAAKAIEAPQGSAGSGGEA